MRDKINQVQRRVVVVLGTQRSGTSTITAGLKSLGVDLGGYLSFNLSPDNERGFFEDLEINILTFSLLNSLGYTWDMTFLPIFDESAFEVFSAFRPVALEIIKRRLEKSEETGYKIFGFKDPVMCRVLPLWQIVFKDLGLDVSYVIALRNPMSVARSIQIRDGFDLIKGYYIWLNSMVASLMHTVGSKRVVVEYDNVMSDPEAQLRRIADRLSLNFDPNSQEFKEYKDEFLTDSLRHTKFDINRLKSDKDISSSVKELYALLNKLAIDEIAENDVETSTVIKKTFSWLEDMRSTFVYLQACEDAVRYVCRQNK